MEKFFWMIAWYVFCALAIGLFIFIYRLINRSPFRSDEDISTEVGYEEDGTGHVIAQETPGAPDGNERPPHIRPG